MPCDKVREFTLVIDFDVGAKDHKTLAPCLCQRPMPSLMVLVTLCKYLDSSAPQFPHLIK
jgi:hypothetical protein